MSTRLEACRARLLAEMKGLSPDQLAKGGVRADGSEVWVLYVIQQLALHDQDHRRRITVILRGSAGLAPVCCRAPSGIASSPSRRWRLTCHRAGKKYFHLFKFGQFSA